MKIAQLAQVFIVAFALNFIWEHAHAVLYASYQGGVITNLILLHATFVDAIFITAVAALYVFIPFFRARLYLLIIVLLCVSVGIEWWALATHRWVYGPYMPIIPFLSVGLTPVLQLPVLGCISLLLAGV